MLREQEEENLLGIPKTRELEFYLCLTQQACRQHWEWRPICPIVLFLHCAWTGQGRGSGAKEQSSSE